MRRGPCPSARLRPPRATRAFGSCAVRVEDGADVARILRLCARCVRRHHLLQAAQLRAHGGRTGFERRGIESGSGGRAPESHRSSCRAAGSTRGGCRRRRQCGPSPRTTRRARTLKEPCRRQRPTLRRRGRAAGREREIGMAAVAKEKLESNPPPSQQLPHRA